MNSLAYIIVKSAKNWLLELFRKPGKLIMYLLVLAGLLGLIVMSMTVERTVEDIVDIIWLKGILFALILLFFTFSIQKALKSGDVIFGMSDVNFLFVSPIKPQSILLYGVVRMAAMSFAAGLFIPFQASSLASFGVRYSGVMVIFFGFILAVSLMQLLSLVIYSLTNGKPRRKMAVRILCIAMFLPMVISALQAAINSGGDMTVAVKALLEAPSTSWTPIVGWTAEAMIASMTRDIQSAFLFFGIISALGIILVIYIIFSNPDYYEDVLVATETAFEKKRAVMEGNVTNPEAISSKKIKVTTTGIGGIGASALFGKHLRESFRANRLGLWGIPSIAIVAGAAALSAILAASGSSDGGVLILLQVLMWFQVFMIGTGRGIKELYSHYIYMIPESSYHKIIWSNIEVVFKVFVESIFIFCISGIILRESPLLIISAIAVYSAFSLFLLGINYLSMRWTGADMSGGFLITIYLIAVIAALLPGLVAAIIAGLMIEGWGIIAGMGILTAWELAVALVCFASSKGILHKCDMPAMRTGKE